MIVKNVKQNVGHGLSFVSWLAFTGKLSWVKVFGGLGGVFSCSFETLVYMLRKVEMLSLSCQHIITQPHKQKQHTNIAQHHKKERLRQNFHHPSYGFYTWPTK